MVSASPSSMCRAGELRRKPEATRHAGHATNGSLPPAFAGVHPPYELLTGHPQSGGGALRLIKGAGMANGLANIHNANKASTPMVNIVGDHATYHRRYDAPLTTDIETAARPFSRWVKTSPDARSVAADGAAAIAAARMPPGQIATLILPADTAWNEGSGPVEVPPAAPPTQVSPDAVAGP